MSENEIVEVVDDPDLLQWSDRQSVFGKVDPYIERVCAREQLIGYLEHIALGGKTKSYLEPRNLTWNDVNEWLCRDPKLYDLFTCAQRLAARVRLNLAEDELMRRAVDGIDKPVYHQGKMVDTYKEYSDQLLVLLLKAGNPDKYADRQKHEVKGVMLNLTVAGVR